MQREGIGISLKMEMDMVGGYIGWVVFYTNMLPDQIICLCAGSVKKQMLLVPKVENQRPSVIIKTLKLRKIAKLFVRPSLNRADP